MLFSQFQRGTEVFGIGMYFIREKAIFRAENQSFIMKRFVVFTFVNDWLLVRRKVHSHYRQVLSAEE